MDGDNKMLMGDPDESSDNYQDIQEVQVPSSLAHYSLPGSDDERNPEELLYIAISKGRLQKVQELLRAGVKTNIINRNYNTTPLHYAVESRQYDIVEELLLKEWKTNVDAKNANGDTPLHIATLNSDRDLVHLLVKNQANVNVENSAGMTPIELAEDPGVISVLDKYCKLAMNSSLLTKISVPDDGSCLFWATALAYLYPVKQNNDAFQERFQKLFGNVSSMELSLVRDLIQQYHPCVNDADVLNNKALMTLVAEKFRKRVVAEMSSRQKQFEDSITTYDFLYSKQEDYVTGGKFQKGFLHEFSQEVIQYNIDITKLKPDVFNKATIEIIDSELSKVPDQHHVRQFIFKSYLECMSNRTAWGGNHELQAVSEILCCSILVFYDYDKHVICHDAGNDQLQLFNNREVHYEFGLVSGQVLIEAIKSSKLQKAKMFLDLGVDNVNYQDSAGFTALHYAVYCRSAEITQLLLKQGAKSDVRNCSGETPVDMAISSENDTVASILQAYQPRLISAQQKHEETDSSQADTYGKKRSHMVSFLHQDYEVKLIMLFLLQGLSKTKDGKISNFYLATHVAEVEMFDTIFKYKYKDQYGAEKSKIIFLLVKYKLNADKGKIAYARLLSKSKRNPLSLKQCFNSYKKTKQLFLNEVSDHPLFDGKFEHTDCDFIIYTNASFAFEETPQNAESKCVDPDSVLYQEVKPECNHYYELAVNEDNRKKILDTMLESSDSLQLAKELVKSVLCDESPTVSLCCEGIVRKYCFPLLESVIIRETQDFCSFRVSFLNGDVNLSSHDKIFRDTFFAEAVKITKKTEDELKVALSSKLIMFHSDQLKGDDLDLYLPSDLVSELEVKEFFRKLKLFCDQPDGNELGEIIRQKIQLVYSVPQNDVDLIYSDVKNKVQRWWKSENSYLTEMNRFFQDSVKTSIFFYVKKPVTMFTGRSKELEKLHSLMQVYSQAVITGMGGIGKTELARYYIYCFRNHYENVIWINATNRMTLTMSFHELGERTLRLSIADENGMDRDINHTVKEMYNFFSKRKSVFVFDDCENYEEICEFLPSHSVKFNQKDLYILLTSRCQEWGNEIPCLVLGEFSMEEAMGFVKQKLNISPHDASQDEEIKSFVMKLHCFPLAIGQAVAYIEYQRENGNYGFSDHAIQFEQVLLTFEEYGSVGRSHHLKPLFAILEFITTKLNHDEQHGQTALEILDTISYFALKINVRHEMFLSLADGNKKQLNSVVHLLVMNSVLAREQKGDVLTIHPLVQQLRRAELRTKGLEEEKLKTVLKLVKSYLDEQTASHAVAAWSYASKYEDLIKEFSKLPSQIISVLLDSVGYKEAFIFGIGSFELLAKLLGPLHADTLITFTNIIKVLYVQGINEDTVEFLEKIKLILDSCRWESLAPEDGSKMKPVDQKNYDEILTTYQEIIDGIINESVLMRPRANQNTVFSTTTVAPRILSSTGILDGKLKTIKEEVDKEKKTWGPDHPKIFLSEIKLAEILFQKGNYCNALRTYEVLLKKGVKILGPDHLHILKIENGMCEVYFAQGNYVVAQEMCTKILEKYRQIIGSQHPDTLRTEVLLAKILASQGYFYESLSMYLGCLTKIVQLLGPRHCDVLRTENLIAEVLCKQEKNSEAMEVYQKVLDRFVPVLGPDDLDILQTKSGIASIYFKQGNYERALRTYCEIFNKQIALLGIEHLHTLFTLNNIHHVLFNSGKLLKLAYIHSEYNDMHDICTFDECCRLLLYWISFSSEELDLATHFGAGATTNLPDNFDWSHLNLATMIAKQYILNYLTKKASCFKTADKSSSSFIRTLYKAVEKDELDIVKTLVECTDFIASDRHDLTPVHIAVQEGHLDIIKYFVLKGINLNVPNENGLTLLERATYSGKLDIARFLIEKGADVNVLNKDGLTLLHWASVNGNLRTVKCLVEKGADVNILNKDGLTPLCLAVSRGYAEIVKYLVSKGADVNVHDKNGLTLLHTAVSVGDVNTFIPLINDPDYLSAFDIDDLTLLHRASSQGRLNIVKYLVENGADINIQNKNRLTPLHLAAQKGKLSVIRYLISQKANCGIQDEHGFTPLHFAANAGKAEVVEHLVQEGADVNAETKDGETVLHTAIRSGCLDAVRCLTEKGAYLMKPDVNLNTPLEEAVKGDNDDIAKFLIKAYAKSLNSHSMQSSSKGTEHENSSDISFLTPIYFAVMKGYLDIVEYLVNEDTNNIYYTDKDDQSLLHLAAGKGYLDVINFLLRKGADINHRNAYEETPLYDAINNNYYSIVQCFAEKGAELNCVNKRSESPLHRAVFAGYLEIVMFLVDSDVCIDTQDKYGNTPLHYAVKQGNLSLVKYLLAEGACIDTVNNYGKSTLHLCIETEEENFSVVEFLVEVCPSQKFAIDDNGWTVLHSAAYWDHPGVIEFLLEKGVNVNVRNYNYEAPLHLASSGSSIYAVKALLKRKANVDARDNDDKRFLDVASPSTRKEIESLKGYLDFIERPWYRNEELLRLLNEPIVLDEIQSHLEKEKIDINAGTLENETFLHFVSRKGSKELVKMALEQGADIYATTDIAETALHLAARVGNTEVLQLLLSNGINASFKNDHGETALHEAARIGNEECVELLFDQDSYVINDTTAFGNTALHNAVVSRHLKIAEFLLSKGFEIDHKNVYGDTPLFVAVRAGNEAMVTLLLKYSADIKTRNYRGNTCVHIASMKGKRNILQLLLDAGAEVNSRNFFRETPLHLACNENVVELLVDSGADVNARTSKLPIHKFAEKGDERSIRVMLSCSRDCIFEQDVDGSQPIHVLAREGHVDSMKLLYGAGASLDAKDLSGVRPIHLAAREGHLNVVQYILEQIGISGMIEVQDDSGYQPIHVAAREGHRHIVEFILEKKGHLVNSRSAYDVVPLHLAARNLHMDVITCLIRETACSIDAKDKLMHGFLHHFFAGLFNRCKKYVAVVVERVALLLKVVLESKNRSSMLSSETQSDLVFTSAIRLESVDKLWHVFELRDITDAETVAKIEQIPWFCNVLRYYNNVTTLAGEVLNLVKIISDPKNLNDVCHAYNKMKNDIEGINKNIQENVTQIKNDSSNQDLEVIFHFLRFLFLTLDITLLKFSCCLQQFQVTQQICKKETLLANYAEILNKYCDFVNSFLNKSVEKALDTVDKPSFDLGTMKEALEELDTVDKPPFDLGIMKEALEKLDNLEHLDTSDEASREQFYWKKIEYYVQTSKLEIPGMEDEKMKAIQRLATQRSLQVMGDGEAIKSLKLKLHVDSTAALINLRNNYLSHLTNQNNLFARVMAEFKPEVFDVVCDLDVISKIYTNEFNEGTKLNAIQNLSEHLGALSKMDCELQKVVGRLRKLNARCKQDEQFLLLEENTKEIYQLHGKRTSLKSSLKEKFSEMDHMSKMIDEYFLKVSELKVDSSKLKLFLAVPFFERQLALLENTVLKDSCIEKILRENLSFTVNQKPVERIMLCLRNCKQLQIAMEFLIFDLRSIVIDPLKECNNDFHQEMKEKLKGFFSYPWLRNHLAHLSHGSALCHELTDLSKVCASNAFMLMKKGKLLTAFIGLCFKMHQSKKEFSEQDTACLFGKIGWSDCRVEFLLALKEVGDIEELRKEADEFIKHLSDVDFQKMLLEWRQVVEFLKLLQECLGSCNIGRLKSKTELFFRGLNEEEFTDQLLRLFQDNEYLKIVQDIMGHTSLTEEVEKYLNIKKLNLGKFVKMDNYREFFKWLHDLVKGTPKALKALQVKVKVTVNVLKSQKHCSESSAREYFRVFSKELDESISSAEKQHETNI